MGLTMRERQSLTREVAQCTNLASGLGVYGLPWSSPKDITADYLPVSYDFKKGIPDNGGHGVLGGTGRDCELDIISQGVRQFSSLGQFII